MNKLCEFKTHSQLKYEYAIEVVIGDTETLDYVKQNLEQFKGSNGEDIFVLLFNVDNWKVAHKLKIRYTPDD